MKLSKELQQAYDAAQGLIAERAKLSGLIGAAETRAQAATTEQTHAFERLAEEESADALLEGPLTRPGKPNPALRTISALRDEVSGLQARVAGLYAKYDATEARIEPVQSAFATAYSNFTLETLAAYREEYQAAAEAFLRVARRGTAIYAGLGLRSPLDAINLPDPADPRNPIARIGRIEMINGRWAEVPDCDAASQAIVAALAPVQQLSAALSKEVARLRTDRHEAAQAAMDADAPNRPKGTTMEPSTAYRDQVAAEQGKGRPGVEHIATTMYPNNPERRTVDFGHMNPSRSEGTAGAS